jgi:signal transduction histidine kinase
MFSHLSQTCLDATANLLGIFDTTLIPTLLPYAYIPTVIISLVAGLLVLLSNTKFKLPSYAFFFLCVTFCLYLVNETLQWVLTPTLLVAFSWQIIILLKVLLLFFLLYFNYTFLLQKRPGLIFHALLIIPLIPIFLFVHTKLNIIYFDNYTCQGTIGPLFYYIYILEALAAVGILAIAVTIRIKRSYVPKKLVSAVTAGSLLFLLFLFLSDFIGEYTGEFEYLLIGPIGMLLYLTAMTYIIVKFQAFNIRLISAQALVFGLLFLIASQFLFIKSFINVILTAVNFILLSIGGYVLVKGVKNEMSQRQEIEKLAKNLERSNERLKMLDKQKSEFVSIASHQLRSPLTAIRGYASMILEGSFGTLPDKVYEPIRRIEESSRFMATSIDDFLNVSRIESGNMKYDFTNIDLVTLTRHIVEDLQTDATKRGLTLEFKTHIHLPGKKVFADHGKLVQIIHNIINNALKYTKEGVVTVCVNDDIDTNTVSVEVRDTGIGMSEETIGKLFEKFSRANIASSTNIMGTGLGLFVAREMAKAMKGNIEGSSAGEGKGSTFIFSMPYNN